MKTRKTQTLLFATIVLFIYGCEIYDPNESGYLVPLLVTENAELPSIYVNGTQMHSQAFGDPNNPMIVAIHGGPGGDYRALLNCTTFVNDGYYVIFYDQRGSGLSERHNSDVFTTECYINDLNAVIEHYKSSETQKVILLGHSWGAMLAAGYINTYPSKVDAVVLSEPGGFTWEQTLEYIDNSQKLDFFSENVNDWVYQDQFITSNDHELLDYKMLTATQVDTKVGVSETPPYWRLGAVCNSSLISYARDNPFDFTTNLKLFQTKVLFAYSELNESYGKAHAEKVSSAFPNVELVLINGCGHSIPYTGWNSYYQETKEYLNGIF